ncbi:unnamed protein product, partial [Pleuronectes platessa]
YSRDSREADNSRLQPPALLELSCPLELSPFLRHRLPPSCHSAGMFYTSIVLQYVALTISPALHTPPTPHPRCRYPDFAGLTSPALVAACLSSLRALSDADVQPELTTGNR